MTAVENEREREREREREAGSCVDAKSFLRGSEKRSIALAWRRFLVSI
jgi:hypothetical protein